jgi:hypothetical protein
MITVRITGGGEGESGFVVYFIIKFCHEHIERRLLLFSRKHRYYIDHINLNRTGERIRDGRLKELKVTLKIRDKNATCRNKISWCNPRVSISWVRVTIRLV